MSHSLCENPYICVIKYPCTVFDTEYLIYYFFELKAIQVCKIHL